MRTRKVLLILLAIVITFVCCSCGSKNAFVAGNLLYDLGAESLDAVEKVEFLYKEKIVDIENRPEITEHEDISILCNYTYASDCPKDMYAVLFAFPNDSFYVTIHNIQYQLYLHEDGALTTVPNDNTTARTYTAEEGKRFTYEKFKELIQKYQ